MTLSSKNDYYRDPIREITTFIFSIKTVTGVKQMMYDPI